MHIVTLLRNPDCEVLSEEVKMNNENLISKKELLEKYGISYKNGEEYLLTEEIIRRTY